MAAPKGHPRYGGRKPGKPNKSTTEAMLVAKAQLNDANAFKRKLARECLDDMMHVYGTHAMRYQDWHRDEAPAGPETPDQRTARLKRLERREAMFAKYAQRFVDTATSLAPYQSPTFRSIQVAPAPTGNDAKRIKYVLDVFDHAATALDDVEEAEIVPRGNGHDE